MKSILRLVLLSVAVCGTAVAVVQAAGSSRPNILFILCDDLGINDLHCYGRADHRTPNLDRLATQGTRFTSAYCGQPICSPSRAALLTGKAPARLHLTTYLPGRANAVSQKLLHPEIQMQVPLEEKMLPEYLKPLGYATAAFGKWHVGGKGFGPLEQGFDLYHVGRPNTVPSATEGGKGEYDLTAAAEAFMEKNRARPFLVYLAHNTPHIPYTAQQRRIDANAGAFEPVYAGVIETLDDSVGRLLAKLESLGLAENTIVVFTSDNGGLHVPEGTHRRVTHNTPYRAGKGYVYEGGMRIPLIVRWPGRIPAGRVVVDPVVNTDWIPTLLELVGGPAPAGLDGRTFAAFLRGTGPAPARPFFWHFPHYNNQGGRPTGAMRDGNWMLVEYYDEDRAEIFDLARDVREERDVAAQQPERVARMRAALVSWRRDVGAQGNRPNPNYDPAKFRQLYLDFDSSRFEPPKASGSEWERVWEWRRGMNEVLPASRKKAKRTGEILRLRFAQAVKHWTCSTPGGLPHSPAHRKRPDSHAPPLPESLPRRVTLPVACPARAGLPDVDGPGALRAGQPDFRGERRNGGDDRLQPGHPADPVRHVLQMPRAGRSRAQGEAAARHARRRISHA